MGGWGLAGPGGRAGYAFTMAGSLLALSENLSYNVTHILHLIPQRPLSVGQSSPAATTMMMTKKAAFKKIEEEYGKVGDVQTPTAKLSQNHHVKFKNV